MLAYVPYSKGPILRQCVMEGTKSSKDNNYQHSFQMNNEIISKLTSLHVYQKTIEKQRIDTCQVTAAPFHIYMIKAHAKQSRLTGFCWSLQYTLSWLQ